MDVCDVCDKTLGEREGYLLTPLEVLSTPGYWQKIFCDHDSIQAALGKSNVLTKTELASRLAAQAAPWMVCNDCIHIFSVDKDKAKGYANEWYKTGGMFAPPGSGPVPLSEVRMGDSSAYLKAEAASGQPRKPLPIKLPSMQIPMWWMVLILVAVVSALLGGIYYKSVIDEAATEKAHLSPEGE